MSAARYQPGDAVRVRDAYPPGHVRTPFFVRGHTGVIEKLMGTYRNPEELAYGRDGKPALPLYRVRFEQSNVWDGYDGGTGDSIVVDVYENWLEPDR